MSQGVILSKRDLAILQFLDVTPATVAHVRRVSATFPDGPFRDERRTRERLHTLGKAGFIRAYPASLPAGGMMSYYRLTPEGYRAAFPSAEQGPPRASHHEVAPSRLNHAMIAADVIVHTLVASHARAVRVQRMLGDGRLTLEVGEYRQQPDFHFQLGFAARTYNLVFEIDNATEPLDSRREHSIRTKILGYETYQNWVMRLWWHNGRDGDRPAFRVVFLTTSTERARHILWLAQSLVTVPRRRLVYATTHDAYLGERDAVTAPIFNDHHGHWQSLVNPHPAAAYLREPVRLRPPTATSMRP